MALKLFPSLKPRRDKSRGLVRQLILKQRWKCLHQYISTQDGQAEVKSIGCENVDDGQTALHLACKFDPPEEVVRELLEIIPSAISTVNFFGQTPLHVAAPVFESADLIKYLLKQYPAAATVVDREGKTPLILLCEHAHFDVENTPFIMAGYSKAWVEVNIAAVALCVAAPPSMVTVKDITGKSALDYAMENNADMKLIRFLVAKAEQAKSTKTEEVWDNEVDVLKKKKERRLAALWTKMKFKGQCELIAVGRVSKAA